MAEYINDAPLRHEPSALDEEVVSGPSKIGKEPVPSESSDDSMKPKQIQRSVQVRMDDIENVWNRRNLLTFDGGGIRGYWSLLVMNQLMDHIYGLEIEPSSINVLRQYPDLHKYPDLLAKHSHSFCPLEYVPTVSQVKLNRYEKRYQRIFRRRGDEVEALDPARRYLPCHYFDFIGGTSTGALIAIMLGRLRMTVMDCLHEYATLGNVIFGNPYPLGSIRMYVGNGTKLRTADAENAFKDVQRRRTEETSENAAAPRFPSEKHMCNTFVTALHAVGKGVQGSPFVLRSYKSPADGAENPTEGQEPIGEVRSRTVYDDEELEVDMQNRARPRRDMEDAHNLEIYQIARAATAAPRYHRPERVLNAKGKEMIFEDAGICEPNPTPRGIAEIRAIHGEDRLGIVVSVGTAKADQVQDKDTGKEFIIGTGKRIIAIATDPDKAHADVTTELRRKDIPYFRLNPDKKTAQKYRLDIPMDSWEPKKSSNGSTPGIQTLKKMKQAFDDWYESSDDIKNLFHKCAVELVVRRRLRMQNHAKWERYVLGSTFLCPLDSVCKRRREYTFHDRLEQHYHKKHNNEPLPQKVLLDRARLDGWKYQGRETSYPLMVY